MRIKLGSPVHCSGEPCGELADVVVDPRRRRVTHLVVEPHHRHRRARLVPVELASAGENSDAVELDCSTDELRRLPYVEEFAYLRLAEFRIDDPARDIGIDSVLAAPYYNFPNFVGSPMAFDPHLSIVYDRIPKGEVEIRRTSEVVSADDHRVGHVDGFLVDADDRITHLVLERGHLFGRQEVTVPIGAVARVATDSVALTLTKKEVGHIPSLPVRRWNAGL